MKTEYLFEHFGVPVKEKQNDMIYFPEYKVWATDYEKSPYRIELIYFEKDTHLHPLIQSTPHVCYLVKDIRHCVLNKKILLAPVFYQDYYMAFIEENNVPIEFIQPTMELK